MTAFQFELTDRTLILKTGEGSTLGFPWLWLRDNEPAAFHPQTRERRFDLLSVPADLRALSGRIEGGDLLLQWPDLPGPRRYALDWLIRHAPGETRSDPADIAPVSWSDDHRPARFEARSLAGGERLLDMLTALKRNGMIIVQGIDGDDGGVGIGRSIGFLRESNFGTIFDVVSMPDPNNQAYTSDDLDLHTDLPNQQLVPGYQFLHCVRNRAAGGESLFCDGFRVLSDFRTREPDAWEILRAVKVPYRFRDQDTDLRQRRAVIECDPEGRPVRMAFNPGILDIVDLPERQAGDWYDAWRRLRLCLGDHPCRITYLLRTGEMAVFDNSRILHGRKRFDPASGERRLRGFYIDRGEVDSRIRVLNGAQHT
ncbi:TauD/TfdA family dioxygenase [Minwuia sp.]|uniref:TauD/TfdA family dioxygenase n=1 Tax=Minwuia sp. TaxID=2493630 RepID=UPI003A92220D